LKGAEFITPSARNGIIHKGKLIQCKPGNINKLFDGCALARLAIFQTLGYDSGKYVRGIEMKALTRITFDPQVMGGKPCIRGMRVTVGMIVGMLASGHTKETVLGLYPYLEPEDVDEALSYAAWRVEEIDVPVVSAST
jgi:uncharacterized protein (DUF433 family)